MVLPKPLVCFVLQYLVSKDNYYKNYVNDDFYQQLLVNRYGIVNVAKDESFETLTHVYRTLKILTKLNLYPTVKSFNYLVKNFNFSKSTLFDCYRTNCLLSITQYYSLYKYVIPNNLVYPTPALLSTSPFTTDEQCKQIYNQLLVLVQKPTEYVTIKGIKINNFDIDCLLYNHCLVSANANTNLNQIFMLLFNIGLDLMYKYLF